jgi:SOS-response transcriptional repressor LexA
MRRQATGSGYRRVTTPPSVTAPPTPTQAKVLDYMRTYHAKNGAPPTVREIAEVIGVRSTNTVVGHLQALARKGLVRHHARPSRNWVAVASASDEAAP